MVGQWMGPKFSVRRDRQVQKCFFTSQLSLKGLSLFVTINSCNSHSALSLPRLHFQMRRSFPDSVYRRTEKGMGVVSLNNIKKKTA